MGFFDLFRKQPLIIKVSRTNEFATLPVKNHSNKFADAAYDLFALTDPTPDPLLMFRDDVKTPDTQLVLKPNQRKLVGTGIRVAIPDGYWLKFHERSGLANKGIHVLGGVIDSGYTGELKVIMYNSGGEILYHDLTKAIAQFTVEKVTESELSLVSQEQMNYEAAIRERQDKGFGSSDGEKTN